MCEPTTIALAGLAFAAVGTGVSVYGAMAQGQAQKDQANYTAQVAKNNATVAAQNAAAVQDQAAAKAQADVRAGSQRAAAQRAALGASGVTGDSGSAVDVLSATEKNTALTTQQDVYQGQMAAYGYNSQGANFNAQAGLDTLTASNASTAGTVNAGTTLLSGASQVSNKWSSYLQTGPYGSSFPMPTNPVTVPSTAGVGLSSGAGSVY